MTKEEFDLLLLKHVQDASSQHTLAKQVGSSVGKINYVLKALIDKGFVKSEHFLNAQNKKKYKYLLTEEGIKEKIALTQKFIARKKAEYEMLELELEADKARWGDLQL